MSEVKSPSSEHRKVGRFQTLAGVAGNVLEWYDFAIYGYFADILSKVFFPPQEGSKQLIESFAVFGGAFLVRPLGGIIMGWIGDKQGRKKALEQSVFLMAVPTFLMGCLPTYDQVGDAAFVLLVIVRLFQGLSVGGQFMSSLVFTLENQPRETWGLYGSYVYIAANMGTMLGSLVGAFMHSVLTEDQLVRWGWRIPFLFGILVAFVGMYLRYYCSEELGHEPPKNPLASAFGKGNRRRLVACSLVPMMGGAGFYTTFVWLPVFMRDLVKPGIEHAFWINFAALLLSTCCSFPFFGWLSDRVGRSRVVLSGIVLFGIVAPFALYVMSEGEVVLSAVSQLVMALMFSLYAAPMLAWLAELFPAPVRLTSMAIGYNIANAIMGGLSPGLATYLATKVGPVAPGFYLSIVAVISFVGFVCIAPDPAFEKEEKPVDDDDDDGEFWANIEQPKTEMT